MNTYTSEERIALLFSALDSEVANAAIQSMHPTRAQYVNRLIKDFRENPPSDEEQMVVLNDFFRYFQFAMQSVAPLVSDSGTGTGTESNGGKPGRESIELFPKIVLSGDPIIDLNNLDPYQISQAMESDHPKTIALVLCRIDADVAARVLTEFEEEVRNRVIVFLSHESTVPSLIVEQVLRSTVQKSMEIESRTVSVEQTQIVAELIRSVPKTLRAELLEKLEESDEEFFNEVKSRLYEFDDLRRLGDRDVQKLLGEFQTEHLIVGLQGADQEIIDKVANNLSKRARHSLLEEMEYKTNATEEDIEFARSELTAVIARLDEAGDISLS